VILHFAIDNNIDYEYENEDGIISNYLGTLAAVEAADTNEVLDILVLMDSYDKTDPMNEGYVTPFTDGYYEITGGSFSGDLKQQPEKLTQVFLLPLKPLLTGSTIIITVTGWCIRSLIMAAVLMIKTKRQLTVIAFDDSNNDALSHKELAQVSAYLKVRPARI